MGLLRRQSGEASRVHFSEVVGGLNNEFGLTVGTDLSCHGEQNKAQPEKWVVEEIFFVHGVTVN